MKNPLPQTEDSAYESLDLCGLRCPHLLISVIAAIRSLTPGQKLQIRATDLNAPSSITAWSRQSGNDLLDMYQEGECFVFLIERNPDQAAKFNMKQATAVQKEEAKS